VPVGHQQRFPRARRGDDVALEGPAVTRTAACCTLPAARCLLHVIFSSSACCVLRVACRLSRVVARRHLARRLPQADGRRAADRPRPAPRSWQAGDIAPALVCAHALVRAGAFVCVRAIPPPHTHPNLVPHPHPDRADSHGCRYEMSGSSSNWLNANTNVRRGPVQRCNAASLQRCNAATLQRCFTAPIQRRFTATLHQSNGAHGMSDAARRAQRLLPPCVEPHAYRQHAAMGTPVARVPSGVLSVPTVSTQSTHGEYSAYPR
jgi:hypothetical protein